MVKYLAFDQSFAFPLALDDIDGKTLNFTLWIFTCKVINIVVASK